MSKVFTNFNIFHVSMLFYTLATFFIVAVISFIIQIRMSAGHLSAKEFINHCFPFEEWKKKTAKMDLVIYFADRIFRRFNSLVEVPALIFFALCIQYILTYLLPNHTPWEFSYFVAILCAAVIFVAQDFGKFLSHYLLHFVPILWELHKVHHSATFLNPATADRFHPVENTFDRAFTAIFTGSAVGLTGFFYKLSIPVLLLLFGNANMLGTVLVLDVIKHSQFPISFGPLDKYVLSPHMHHLHHSGQRQYWDKNFGSKLSIWDRMFGTFVKPSKNEKFIYGLSKPGEDEDYTSVAGVYLSPMTKIWNLVYGVPENAADSEGAPVKRRWNFGAGVLWRHREVEEPYAELAEPGSPKSETIAETAAQQHGWLTPAILADQPQAPRQQPST